jgi:hypothetical protein
VGLAIGALVFGCVLCAVVITMCRKNVAPEDAVDGWSMAREALTSGEYCYAGRAEFCLTDPAFVDAAIRPRLEELYGGEMPPRRAHVEAVIRAAAIVYRRDSTTPDNVARIEELVKERYLNPKITVTDDTVSADMGVVPGSLSVVPSTMSLKLVESEYLDKSEWSRAEVERMLTSLAERYPDKNVVRVSVTLPWANGLGVMSYRWIQDERRVVVTSPEDEMRTTKRLESVSALHDKTLSLRFWDLPVCTASRTPSPPDQDPPHLCARDRDPAAPAAESTD